MSSRTHRTMALLAVTAAVLAIAPSASAQYRYETPDGHQLVGPSEMPQQQGAVPGTNAKPRLLGAPNQPAPAQNKTLAPQSTATTPGATAQPGSIVLPQGGASPVRVSPVEHITLSQRALMAAWLLLLFLVISVIAVAIFVNTMRDQRVYQGGHQIDEDSREPIRHAT